MSDIELTDVKSGYNLGKINENFDKVETVVNNDVMHLEGGNNIMRQDMDINGKRILNAPAPSFPTDYIRAQDLPDFLVDTESLILTTNTENVALTSGQTVVILSGMTTSQTSFFISGLHVDQGRLLPTTDYTVDSDTQITLVDSYPAGTVITAVQNQGYEADTDILSDVRVFGDVALMKAASLVAGDSVMCPRYYAGGDLVDGLKYYIKTAAQAATDGDISDGYINHTLGNGNVAILKYNKEISLAQAGYVEGDNAKLFIKAIKDKGAIVSDGNKRAFHAPTVNVEETPTLCFTPTANITYAISESESEAGYTIISMVNNVTTLAQSLATTTSEATSWRVAGVFTVSWCCTGFTTQSSQVGTWQPVTLSTQISPMPVFDAARFYTYLRSESNANDSLTYNNVPVVDGVVKLSFLNASGSNPAATISVDGTNYTVDLTEKATSIQTYTFPAFGKQEVDIVITNSTGGPSYQLNFMGAWFTELKDWKKEYPVDSFGYYRNTVDNAEYLEQNSENDYVIKEYNSDIFGGGYHGGETSITDVWLNDGVAFSPSSSAIVSNKLTLQTSCVLDWNPVGQNTTVNVNKNYVFGKSGYSIDVKMSGPMEVTAIYSTIFGVSHTFDNVKCPNIYDLTTDVQSGENLFLGRTNKVIYEHPTTDQKLSVDMCLSPLDDTNPRGGAFIWRVDNTYNKLYYTPTITGYLSLPNGYYSFNRYKFL